MPSESASLRFLADMGISGRVVEWLHTQEYDTKHLRDEGLQRMEDPKIFEKAADEKRVILTFDLDFGEIVAFSRQAVVSVVVFRLHNTSTPHVIDRLATVLPDCQGDLQAGAIIVIEESRYRVRHLPIRRDRE